MTSREQILYMVDFLRQSGILCKVTLVYPDYFKYPDIETRVNVNLKNPSNKKLMSVFKETRLYFLSVKIGKQKFEIWNNRPEQNECVMDNIKRQIPEETFINQKRWTRLDDILNDPTPLKLT